MLITVLDRGLISATQQGHDLRIEFGKLGCNGGGSHLVEGTPASDLI
jgi:hypothetical protein